MTAYLSDIAPLIDFEKEVAERHITMHQHPSLPLDILCYTRSTQYSKHWNAVTSASRGLIVNRETKEIVSRPLGKFFNHGEAGTPKELLRGPVSITDKLDGSLVISVPTPDGFAMATKRNFGGEQAEHATKIYRERYHGTWEPIADHTYLWEVIFPDNRIVLDYGQLDDIFLIAAVDNTTGRSIPAAEVTEWPGQRVREFAFNSIEDMLAAEPRPNAEGYVAHYTETDVREKFKQRDYLRLHAIITEVNSRRIWEVISVGGSVDDFLFSVPEEFEEWVRKIDGELREARVKAEADLWADVNAVRAVVGDVSAKDFAAYVQANYPNKARAGMIMTANARGTSHMGKTFWGMVRPDHEEPFFRQGA